MPVHGWKHQMDDYYAERGYRRQTVRKQAAERCVTQQCRPCWCGYQVGRRSHETSTTTPLRHEIGSGHLDSNFNDCTAINIQRWSGYGSLGSTSHLKIALLHFLALGRLLWAMLGAYWWEKWTLFDCVIDLGVIFCRRYDERIIMNYTMIVSTMKIKL